MGSLREEIVRMLTMLQFFICQNVTVLAIKHTQASWAPVVSPVDQCIQNLIKHETKFCVSLEQALFSLSVMFLEDHYAMCADGHSCYCISLRVSVCHWRPVVSFTLPLRVSVMQLSLRESSNRIGLSGSVYVNQGKLFHQLQGRQGQRSLEGSTESRLGRAGLKGVQNICCEGKEWNRNWKLSLAKQPTHMKMLYFLTDKS